MGAAQSNAAAFAGPPQQLLEQLSGPDPIPFAAPFWDQLFSAAKAPLASLDPEDVEAALAPHCRLLRERPTVVFLL